MKLNFLDQLPDDLLTKSANELHDYLGGPTVLTIKGEETRKVIISILLHGNEISGWEIMKQWLTNLAKPPKLTTILLISNTQAAKENLRSIPNELDFNRLWKPNDPQLKDHELITNFYHKYINDDIEAVIDIHNNNGLNPCYAMCLKNEAYVNAFDLAAGFNHNVISMMLELGTFMEVFAHQHKAVTIECGLPGNREGIDLGISYIDKLVNQKLSNSANSTKHNFLKSRLTINPKIKIGFNGEVDGEIIFPHNYAKNWNFNLVKKGTKFAQLKNEINNPILEFNEKNEEIKSTKFTIQNKDVLVNEDFVPIMLVEDYKIIKQDCLCYTLEEFDAERYSAH